VEEKNKVIGRKYSTLEYIKERHTDLSRGFPPTFLNTQDLTEAISEQLVNKIQDYLIRKYWWKALIAIALFVAIINGLSCALVQSLFSKFFGCTNTGTYPRGDNTSARWETKPIGNRSD
jgi:hypothetical protein